MASIHAAREKDPSIKDVFGLFSSAKDLDTEELVSIRRNTGNFIIAGMALILFLSISLHAHIES